MSPCVVSLVSHSAMLVSTSKYLQKTKQRWLDWNQSPGSYCHLLVPRLPTESLESLHHIWLPQCPTSALHDSQQTQQGTAFSSTLRVDYRQLSSTCGKTTGISLPFSESKRHFLQQDLDIHLAEASAFCLSPRVSN